MTKYRNHIIGLGFFFLLISFLLFIHLGKRQGPEARDSEKSRLIRINKSAIRPDDGDTFYYKGVPIRVLGIDAPEIIHKEHGISQDQPYGRQAAAMIVDLFKKAKIIEYLPAQNDKYGRLLAHVFVDGELLSIHLIKAKLAYENVSYYGDNGFPDLAERILKAAKESPSLPFEDPYKWRRKHQIRK
ncbi:MAG TPA: thermonuclease family protein [Desulfatiglandales bacterium]|nr:thermonuclease family protein [Desulfatiglandales bacterium]